ncbi:MAG: ATP-binding protein [Planctomycetota bacterium]
MTIDWNRRGPAAEKTVSILKQRVRSLHDDGPQTAIHRQLERSREREEKQRQKRAVFMAKTAELERYSKELEATVAQRTADLRAILDNVPFGFVLIDRDAVVQPGFTKSCEHLLARGIAEGDTLFDILGATDSGTESMLRVGVEQVFDDFMPEDVSLEQIPSQFSINSRRIKIDYRVVRTESGDVENILVTISDVTALWESERREQENAALIGILRQKSAFAGFVDDARSRIAASVSAMEDPEIDHDRFVRRAIHTIKGNASSYGLTALAEEAHRIEGYSDIQSDDVRSLAKVLDRFMEQHRDVLGEFLAGGEGSLEVGPAEIRALREMLDPIDVHSLQEWSQRILQRPLSELIGPLEVFVDRIAERLERPVDFAVEGTDMHADPSVMQPVVGTLTHLIRNAIDHGLEPESERGNKPPIGRLRASFREEGGNYIVEVRDDGRGIDVARLASKAVEKGLLSEEDSKAKSREELAQLIFLDGLSSRDEATELSGRGVGMPAVREVVHSHGGDIKLETTPGEGTCIRLELPIP